MVEEVKGYVALAEGSYNFFWKRLGSQMDAAARLLWSFVLVSIGFLDCSFCGIGRVRCWPPCCVAEASASTPFVWCAVVLAETPSGAVFWATKKTSRSLGLLTSRSSVGQRQKPDGETWQCDSMKFISSLVCFDFLV